MQACKQFPKVIVGHSRVDAQTFQQVARLPRDVHSRTYGNGGLKSAALYGLKRCFVEVTIGITKVQGGASQFLLDSLPGTCDFSVDRLRILQARKNGMGYGVSSKLDSRLSKRPNFVPGERTIFHGRVNR